MVSFRITHAGKRTMTPWNRRAGYDHSAACLLDSAKHGVQPSVATQIDHSSIARWPLERPLDQCACYASLLRREDAHHVFLAAKIVLVHGALENRLVESARAIEVSRRYFKPRQR